MATGDTLRWGVLEAEEGGRPLGLALANGLSPSVINLIAIQEVSNDPGTDRITIWRAGSDVSWLAALPRSSTLRAGGERRIGFTFDGQSLPVGVWRARLLFGHNALPFRSEIPVTLTVLEPDLAPLSDILPLSPATMKVSPNPFNGSLTLIMELPTGSRVAIDLLDLQGRVIAVLYEDFVPAGRKAVACDIGNVAAGLYIIRMTHSKGQVLTRVVLVK